MRAITFPYKTYRGVPCPIARISLNGPRGWIHAEAYVDSGATVSIFTTQEADALGLNFQKGRETFVAVGDGGAIPVYLHRLPVRVGPVAFRAMIGFSPRLGVGFNLLGRQAFFTHFDVTFSDSRRLVFFRPHRTAHR